MKGFTARRPEDRPRNPSSASPIRVPKACNYHLAVHIQVMVSREEGWLSLEQKRESMAPGRTYLIAKECPNAFVRRVSSP